MVSHDYEAFLEFLIMVKVKSISIYLFRLLGKITELQVTLRLGVVRMLLFGIAGFESPDSFSVFRFC